MCQTGSIRSLNKYISNMKITRRGFVKKISGTLFTTSIYMKGHIVKGKNYNRQGKGFNAIQKIDLHTHISSDARYLREIMDHLNLKMLTICNEGLKSDRLKTQIHAAAGLCSMYPRYYGWCTTFDLNGIEDPGWAQGVIDNLKQDFDQGALGVKVWKEIGMQLKDGKGNFIQIDDPVFEPIFRYIMDNKKTLFMHIGDPPTYWIHTGSDGLRDAWYKEGQGVWNRIGKFRGEVSFDRLMLARDEVLRRYPEMRFVGCHMGNLSYDLDQLAERLDKYPNYAVETSFSLPFLMGQARDKVRNFFQKYSSRLLYGSDISGGLIASPYLVDMSKIQVKWTEEEIQMEMQDLMEKYEYEFNYFTTEEEFDRGNYIVRGLNLPEEVLSRLFYENAVLWVPGIDKDFNLR